MKSDKKNAIYPGSFDPITKGHMDIIKRSAKSSSFTIEERMDMIKKCTANISNVEVCTFTGLLAEYVKKINVITIIRGLRAVTDFEYEFQMALTNKKINKELETIFLTTNSKYMYLSSSIVKEIARNGGDVTDFVPPVVLADIKSRLDTRN